jgi:hypothetical protein
MRDSAARFIHLFIRRRNYSRTIGMLPGAETGAAD